MDGTSAEMWAKNGGTYMLNVGTDGPGRIPEQSVRILCEVGKWVHAHEGAIHGTDSTPNVPRFFKSVRFILHFVPVRFRHMELAGAGLGR